MPGTKSQHVIIAFLYKHLRGPMIMHDWGWTDLFSKLKLSALCMNKVCDWFIASLSPQYRRWMAFENCFAYCPLWVGAGILVSFTQSIPR